MAKAQFYQRGANWRIFAALTGAIMIEFAAVGLAKFRETEPAPVAANSSQPPPVLVVVTADPPELPRTEETPLQPRRSPMPRRISCSSNRAVRHGNR